MSYKFKKYKTTLRVLFVFLSFILSFNVKAQSVMTPKRVKENFDFNWQFHKGDIAIKREVKAGKQ